MDEEVAYFEYLSRIDARRTALSGNHPDTNPESEETEHIGAALGQTFAAMPTADCSSQLTLCETNSRSKYWRNNTCIDTTVT